MFGWDYDDFDNLPEPPDECDMKNYTFDGDKMVYLGDWYEEHMNPPGTIDCGDGYIDDDGCFTEY